ncbi:Gfo/Idh/MocA family protein [Clostridium brassicae]|uniref:Gfo/Idh/MocA family oxidoreductase n=1 Tax=Clostridium brassicae TaxID=2999072 RepID=A0ABT4DEG4_9CLOT|nr:Gfo/Idh/MocA family oxidoreductase [Clostridium brassicae]MCY6960578.1 Gfo/Idh/MocA family oxidoreductase [Clostridium brassicae]
MKIGIVGIGNIAQKAYLPVIGTMEGIELILCTRNQKILQNVSKKYRISKYVNAVEDLIKEGIDAAFVHATTDAHVKILEKLISNNIHVYVDKPIANTYDEALKITKLAEKNNVMFMVGFNRRFAPMYTKLTEVTNPNIILMEKNRVNSPKAIREVIFDDFIHIIDTLCYLLNEDIKDIKVNSLVKEGKLYNIVIQLEGTNSVAIGTMNRDSGVNEEILELMSPGNKYIVRGLEHLTYFVNGEEKRFKNKDWDPILYRRGFQQIIEHFISCIINNKKPNISLRDALITHELCEKIVNQLEAR